MKAIRIFPILVGIFLVFLGLSIFLEILFGINIPIGRLFGGILLCYIGYYIIVRSPSPWQSLAFMSHRP